MTIQELKNTYRIKLRPELVKNLTNQEQLRVDSIDGLTEAHLIKKMFEGTQGN
jgi:hypothetical protein